MELYKQSEDISVIGIRVNSFPQGIMEAFDGLMKTLGRDRAYYGVSWMDENNNVEYYAMARETIPDEGQKYVYERLIIEKGDYETEALYNWRSKTDHIRDIFHDLMGNSKPDKSRPCIEWYQTDEKMLCMIRAL